MFATANTAATRSSPVCEASKEVIFDVTIEDSVEMVKLLTSNEPDDVNLR